MTLAEIKEAAARGARFLDQRRPGWAEAIDVSTLDVVSVHACPVGQLYDGDYDAGVEALGIGAMDQRVRLGFEQGLEVYETSDDPDYRYWEKLTEAWLDEITARREAARVRRGGKP